MTGSLADVANTMSQQHGLVSRDQLEDEQISNGQIHRLLRSRALEVVHPRVYVLNGSPRTWNQSLMAAVMAAGEGALASHSSAARLWSFKVLPENETFEVTVPRPRRPEVDGVHVHNTSLLADADKATRHRIPCTSFERAVCDSTTTLSWSQLSRVVDDGLRRKITTIERMRECLLRLDSGPERRLSQVQRLLATRDLEYNPGGSGRELRVLDVVTRADLPRPQQQYRVCVGRRNYVLDYAYPAQMRFVEYYELRSHGTPSAVAYDSDRITDLVAVGWQPVLVTDDNSDAEIATRIATALGLPAPTLRWT